MFKLTIKEKLKTKNALNTKYLKFMEILQKFDVRTAQIIKRNLFFTLIKIIANQ